MDDNLDPWIFLSLIPLLALASFASSSETALFSLDRISLKKIPKAHRLIQDPTRVIVVLLFFNELANLSLSQKISTLVEFVFRWLTPHLSWGPSFLLFVTTLVSIMLSAFILLFFGEITPKIIASRIPVTIASFNAWILSFIVTALSPALWLLEKVLQVFTGPKEKHQIHLKHTRRLDEKDVVALLHQALQEGEIAPKEKHLIQKVFHLDDLTCRHIMTPLRKVFSLASHLTLEEARDKLLKNQYSRIPIYHENPRNMIGVLHIKDLSRHWESPSEKNNKITLSHFVRKPLFVDIDTNLIELLKKFKSTKSHLAIVIRGKPGSLHSSKLPLGVVSLEDVLESLFGSIEDERDRP